ncbi:hypothetical protein A0H77_19615 [Vibrio alginolyticus]|uniref:hypothetical protein n=1 Tax=Vibrio alginolyticus TaxID=663 RepID=UPI000792F6AD|nr:hypothetical protein [Vibrio alginolyticus]KXZ35107.1 hypothetical protein A0H77_19615 [Vibrio alginolyticus]
MNDLNLLNEWIDNDKKGFVIALKDTECSGWTHYQTPNRAMTKILTDADIFDNKENAEKNAIGRYEIIPLEMLLVIESFTPLSES